MRKVFMLAYIECDCERTVTLDRNVKKPPPIQQADASCECGRKFFFHVQEVRAKDEPHPNARK